MKRASICFLAFIFTIVFTGTSFGGTIFSDDFESYNVGDFPSKWTQQYSGDSIEVVNSPVASGTKALKIKGAPGLAANIYTNAGMPQSNRIIEADVWLTSNGAIDEGTTGIHFNGAKVTFMIVDSNTLTAYFSNGTKNGEISANEWHHVKMIVDWDNSRYEAVIDGISLYNSTFTKRTAPANTLNLWIHGSNSSASTRSGYWDNIVLKDDSQAITSPTPGSTLTSSSATFTWTSGADEYWLYIGSSEGAYDIYSSGSLGTSTSETVSNLPTDGSILYVRFWYKTAGSWKYNDYTYTAHTGGTTHKITSPTPGSTLTSSSATFTWTSGADEYWLYIGSSEGTYDIYSSGSLGTSTSETVSNLPTDGSILYVRFWYKTAGSWKYNDYTYIAHTGGTTHKITSPTPGSTLTSSSATFTWTSGADEYWLYIGSSEGAYDIYSSGSLGTSTSETVSNLPTDGSILYVRFWYKTAGSWKYNDYTYTAHTGGTTHKITSPTPGSTLTSSSATFTWTSGADEYWLYIGSSEGAYDIYSSGSLGTSTSETVSDLPTDGSILYVRFWYKTAGSWKYNDYTYTAHTGGTTHKITSPTPGSTLPSNVVFQWTSGADEYWLYVGTSEGKYDIYNSNSLGTETYAVVNKLPTDGSTLYVRFWYKTAGSWRHNDYTYTASSDSGLAEIKSPIPGSELVWSSASFNWWNLAMGGYPYEWLYVGTSEGANDIYDSGLLDIYVDAGLRNYVVVNDLPTDGSTIYVRLWYKYTSLGQWDHLDYHYTAASSTSSHIMGSVWAMHYETTLAANLADHVYIQAKSTDEKNYFWRCFGGYSGGEELDGTRTNGDADITTVGFMASEYPCKWSTYDYALIGVCHQLANRSLYYANKTVSQCKGYDFFKFIYGTYGTTNFIWYPDYSFEKCKAAAPVWQGGNYLKEGEINWEILLYDRYFSGTDDGISELKFREYLNELLEMSIRENLGEDFSEKKISELREIRNSILDQKEIIDKETVMGTKSMDENIRRYNTLFNELANRYKTILTRDEYERLFDMDYTYEINIRDFF